MRAQFIPLLLLLTVIPTLTTSSAYASIGSDEFCAQNQGHFACDNENDNDSDDDGKSDEKGREEDNNNNERECDNPPSAASCYNNQDANGVNSPLDSDGEVLHDSDGDESIKENDDWGPSCYDGGYEDGQNGPFDRITYSHCKEGNGDDNYYEGFIDGCISVEGNTRDVCESATDA